VIPVIRPPLPEGIEVLDVELFGASDLSCSYIVHAAEPALVETGPATVFDRVKAELERRRVEPKHIVLTHIHLDHGGGAGHVSELFPDATVWVHDVGARHVVDPSRLVSSARRLFGDALDVMYGEPEPVPEERLRAVDEGDVIPLGDRELRVLYTPGHARHEVTLYEPDARVAFIGDSAGVFIGDVQKPATPPPEFDLEAALDSINRIKELKADAICFTHFGPASEPALDRAAQDLRTWDSILRPLALGGASDEECLAALDHHVPSFPGDDGYREKARALSGARNSMLGYLRYYRKTLLES